jgi:hypothetical protein
VVNPRSINEVKASSIIVNNSLAIDKVSKKIGTLTRLVFLSIFLNILGLSGVVALILIRMFL